MLRSGKMPGQMTHRGRAGADLSFQPKSRTTLAGELMVYLSDEGLHASSPRVENGSWTLL